jgi:hypothetical protein
MTKAETVGIWKKMDIAGYTAWCGETEGIRLAVMPALGCKAASLLDPGTGREWLYQPEQGGRVYGNQGYGSIYKNGDRSGWDEMFPTINPCLGPGFPWENIEIPDHGEVWSIPWEAELREGNLYCEVSGIRLLYRLQKTYQFRSDRRLRINYQATNESADPLPFLWAAHPLLKLREGMRLLVPSGMDPRGTYDWFLEVELSAISEMPYCL